MHGSFRRRFSPVLKTFLPRLEDVFAPSWKRFCLVLVTFLSRPEDVLDQDVLIVVFMTSYRGVGGLHFATDIRS